MSACAYPLAVRVHVRIYPGLVYVLRRGARVGGGHTHRHTCAWCQGRLVYQLSCSRCPADALIPPPSSLPVCLPCAYLLAVRVHVHICPGLVLMCSDGVRG